MLAKSTCNRLMNYKFTEALAVFEGQRVIVGNQQEYMLIRTLSNLFGDSGRFEGEFAILVNAAIDSVLPTEYRMEFATKQEALRANLRPKQT